MMIMQIQMRAKSDMLTGMDMSIRTKGYIQKMNIIWKKQNAGETGKNCMMVN